MRVREVTRQSKCNCWLIRAISGGGSWWAPDFCALRRTESEAEMTDVDDTQMSLVVTDKKQYGIEVGFPKSWERSVTFKHEREEASWHYKKRQATEHGSWRGKRERDLDKGGGISLDDRTKKIHSSFTAASGKEGRVGPWALSQSKELKGVLTGWLPFVHEEVAISPAHLISL